MGQLYDRLDDEQRELHDSSLSVLRMLGVVVVLAVAVWGACSALRWVVHEVTEHGHGWLDGHGPDLIAMLGLAGLLVIGGFVRGLVLRLESWRDAAGDGIHVALENYHVTYVHDGDDPDPRYERPDFALAGRKSVATALTLGTGGSGGLEAPVVVVGEAFGAGVSRLLRARREAELRTFQLAGIAAAVGTLLGTPFTAALFSIEIAYGDRIIYRKFAYALLAAMIAYVLNQRVFGAGPLFVAPPHSHAYSLPEYGVTVLVAVAVSAPLALGFGLLTTHTTALVGRVGGPLRGAAGGLGIAAVTLTAWLAVGVSPRDLLGMGEHTLGALLGGEHPSLLVLSVLLVGKMLTTGFTIGSGGSAGILIPSMFLGGVSGRLTAELLVMSGALPADTDLAIFVVVGIASSLVAVIGVPLASIALVLEVFGPAYGPPAALACAMTYVLTLRLKVYRQQRTGDTAERTEMGEA